MKPIEVPVRGSAATYVRALRAMSYFLTGNRESADDLVEQTIILFDAYPPTISCGSKQEVRIFTVLHDLYFIEQRKSRRAVASFGGKRAQVAPAPSASVVTDDLHLAFWRLCDSEREVLMLSEAASLSREDVASVCGCTMGALNVRVADARNKLIRALAALGEPSAQPDKRRSSFRAVAAHSLQ